MGRESREREGGRESKKEMRIVNERERERKKEGEKEKEG